MIADREETKCYQNTDDCSKDAEVGGQFSYAHGCRCDRYASWLRSFARERLLEGAYRSSPDAPP